MTTPPYRATNTKTNTKKPIPYRAFSSSTGEVAIHFGAPSELLFDNSDGRSYNRDFAAYATLPGPDWRL